MRPAVLFLFGPSGKFSESDFCGLMWTRIKDLEAFTESLGHQGTAHRVKMSKSKVIKCTGCCSGRGITPCVQLAWPSV